MNAATVKSQAQSQVFFMLVSAGLFAYFGFGSNWAHQYTNSTPPVLLPIVVLLKWTMKGGAIVFALAAVLSMVGSLVGPLIYSLAGLVTAMIFVAVGVWEMTNSQGYYSGVPAIVLFIFAAWNGYGSWIGLQEVRAMWGHRDQNADPSAQADAR